jgi:hypothetical protein
MVNNTIVRQTNELLPEKPDVQRWFAAARVTPTEPPKLTATPRRKQRVPDTPFVRVQRVVVSSCENCILRGFFSLETRNAPCEAMCAKLHSVHTRKLGSEPTSVSSSGRRCGSRIYTWSRSFSGEEASTARRILFGNRDLHATSRRYLHVIASVSLQADAALRARAVVWQGLVEYAIQQTLATTATSAASENNIESTFSRAHFVTTLIETDRTGLYVVPIWTAAGCGEDDSDKIRRRDSYCRPDTESDPFNLVCIGVGSDGVVGEFEALRHLGMFSDSDASAIVDAGSRTHILDDIFSVNPRMDVGRSNLASLIVPLVHVADIPELTHAVTQPTTIEATMGCVSFL